MDSYNSAKGAKQYIEFIESDSGKFEQEILPAYILEALDANSSQKILDAGCGTGWLTAVLAQKFQSVIGCDASEELISYAKNKYPKCNFFVSDLTKPTTFPKQDFDAVIANMSLHDMDNPRAALENFALMLKAGGKLIVTISNPYYSLPVGIWKRGFWGWLLSKKPKLNLRPYFFFKDKYERKFSWGKNISSHFYSLDEYLNWALQQHFVFLGLKEIQTKTDSPKFNLQYQLYRFPYILLLEFKKSSQ